MLFEDSLQIAWDYLESLGEIEEPSIAARYLSETIERRLRSFCCQIMRSMTIDGSFRTDAVAMAIVRKSTMLRLIRRSRPSRRPDLQGARSPRRSARRTARTPAYRCLPNAAPAASSAVRAARSHLRRECSTLCRTPCNEQRRYHAAGARRSGKGTAPCSASRARGQD